MTTRVRHGEALASLRRTPPNTFHAMLSDPPYGLGFMGKDWDRVVPPVELWAECLRVLRPGAYALVFGGTRTFHRLAVALEDAGFEIRDCLLWLHGSGFPKSMDVSKALDRDAGKARKVVGTRDTLVGKGTARASSRVLTSNTRLVPITLPATPQAKAWGGYGTALKPAWEPILLVRKPLDGTVARTVRRWGTGALAIDPCRVPHASEADRAQTVVPQPNTKQKRPGVHDGAACERNGTMFDPRAGRFPANVLLDEEAARMLDARTGTVAKAKPARTGRIGGMGGPVAFQGLNPEGIGTWPADPGGGPSRFFYTSKVSTKERNAGVPGGCSHPTLKPLALTTYLARLLLPPGPHARLLVPFSGAGSEMIGARKAGWPHVEGIEQDAQSVWDSRARLAHHVPRGRAA